MAAGVIRTVSSVTTSPGLAAVVGGVAAGVPAGTAALVAALQPVLVAALSGPVLQERARPRQWLGLVLGVAGVGLVVVDDLNTGAAPAWAYLLPATGMLALAAGTLLERRCRPAGSLADAWGVHTMAASLVFVAAATASGQLVLPDAARFWWAVLWTVSLSSAGGYGFYLANLRRHGATRLSSRCSTSRRRPRCCGAS